MKLKHTQARKARRLNNWSAYQHRGLFATPVFERRVLDFFGADHRSFSAKHKRLDAAVEGYKSIQQARKQQVSRESIRRERSEGR